MQDGFLGRLQKSSKSLIFSDEDLKLIFPEKTPPQIHNSLTYHLKQGSVKRFKRGIYSLVMNRGENGLSKFALANILYSPSFISFESALSHWGLIPEAVYEITSACFQPKKKMFETEVGMFSYNYSPVTPFFLDVKQIEGEANFLMATALRALFDLINLRRKNYKELSELESDLRVDLVELKKIVQAYDASELIELGELYKKANTRKFALLLLRGLK